MKSVLLVSYYFPPHGMGGVQRSAKFVRYLPDFGWVPLVLTVKPNLYYAYDHELLSEIPGEAIFRTESLDPGRIAYILSAWKGKVNSGGEGSRMAARLNRWLAFPDSKAAWLPFALHAARSLVKARKPEAVMTTSPPLSAHYIGLRLRRDFGIPWLADFRDYWTAPNLEEYPTRIHAWFNERLRKSVFREADAVTVVSRHMKEVFTGSFGLPGEKCSVLTNGFDLADYPVLAPAPSLKFTMAHTGTLNRINNPLPFLEALSVAVSRAPELASRARFVQAGKWFEADEMLSRCPAAVRGMIEYKGYLSHSESLKILLSGDLLLFMLDRKCLPGWISGRIFEYLPVANPMLAIVPDGEAKNLVLKFGRGDAVHPDAIDEIGGRIIAALRRWERGERAVEKVLPDELPHELLAYSRQSLTGGLAEILCGIQGKLRGGT